MPIYDNFPDFELGYLPVSNSGIIEDTLKSAMFGTEYPYMYDATPGLGAIDTSRMYSMYRDIPHDMRYNMIADDHNRRIREYEARLRDAYGIPPGAPTPPDIHNRVFAYSSALLDYLGRRDGRRSSSHSEDVSGYPPPSINTNPYPYQMDNVDPRQQQIEDIRYKLAPEGSTALQARQGIIPRGYRR